MTATAFLILSGYYLCLSLLSAFGLHRLWLMVGFRKIRQDLPATPPEEWPPMLLQLPIFNEGAVVEELLEKVVGLDYPIEKLTIQVLDDSTDETTELVRSKIRELEKRFPALRMDHIRRGNRTGFKGGALAYGLELSSEDYIAIFDADFRPESDFLKRMLPEILSRPQVGCLQARWAHLNRQSSFLTRAQATLLDGHFRREHAVRSSASLFFNFNGTAGVWRRQAIEDAGGWRGNTLTEDLDLSWRAQLKSWRFLYFDSVAAPAEIPVFWRDLKQQQNRWTRGSLQCARLLMGELWRSGTPLSVKLEGSVPLLVNLAWLLMFSLIFLAFPAFLVRQNEGLFFLLWLDLMYLFPATVAFFLFYFGVNRQSGLGVLASVRDAILAMLLGIGLVVPNSRAALLGLIPKVGIFERTPKGEKAKARGSIAANPAVKLLEGALCLYMGFLIMTAATMGVWAAIPFQVLFLTGLLWGFMEWGQG